MNVLLIRVGVYIGTYAGLGRWLAVEGRVPFEL